MLPEIKKRPIAGDDVRRAPSGVDPGKQL